MNFSKRKPRILIVGAGFRNQGAFLMLLSAVKEIRERFNGIPVMEARVGTQQQRDEIGVQTLLAWQRLNFTPSGGQRSTWRPLKDNLPFIFASDIDAVFDASGFAFSDQWADGKHLERRSNFLAKWAKSVPVYMLPQALGPFEKSGEQCAVALNASALVFARDPESYAFASGIVTNTEKLRKAPDFTIGLEPVRSLGSKLSKFEGGVAVVPNWNILKRAPSDQAKEAYLNGLASVVKIGRESGFDAFGLCHEGQNDKKILEMVREKVGTFEIVDGLDGLESKTLLGTSKFVVSGRFHATVSALSQGVPTVIHGWSHKYEWLAKDFGVPETQCDPYSVEDLAARIEMIVGSRVAINEKLLESKKPLAQFSESMWSAIYEDFNSRI